MPTPGYELAIETADEQGIDWRLTADARPRQDDRHVRRRRRAMRRRLRGSRTHRRCRAHHRWRAYRRGGPARRGRAVAARQRSRSSICAIASIVPGFVDAHAHPLFAGDREPDFAARLRGERPAARHALHGRAHARRAARSRRLLRATSCGRGCARCSRTARRRWRPRPATRCISPAKRRCST